MWSNVSMVAILTSFWMNSKGVSWHLLLKSNLFSHNKGKTITIYDHAPCRRAPETCTSLEVKGQWEIGEITSAFLSPHHILSFSCPEPGFKYSPINVETFSLSCNISCHSTKYFEGPEPDNCPSNRIMYTAQSCIEKLWAPHQWIYNIIVYRVHEMLNGIMEEKCKFDSQILYLHIVRKQNSDRMVFGV